MPDAYAISATCLLFTHDRKRRKDKALYDSFRVAQGVPPPCTYIPERNGKTSQSDIFMARRTNAQDGTTGRNTPDTERPFLGAFPELPKPARREKSAVPVSPPVPPPPAKNKIREEDERALFLQAMGSTAPLRDKEKFALFHDEDAPARPQANQISRASRTADRDMNRETAPASNISSHDHASPGNSKKTLAVDSPAAPADESDMFAQAMTGVSPVRAGGRDLAPAPPPSSLLRAKRKEALENMLDEKTEFAIEYSEEFIEGRVLGLDPLVIGKLRTGQFSREGHLDLHGLNVEQAYASLACFLKESYQSGKRHLLLITGRGRNSPGGAPVLRERVQAWLTRDPFKRVVLAFCSAQPRDGGAGAVYLLLRKRKKSQGKIIWDRTPTEEELLL